MAGENGSDDSSLRHALENSPITTYNYATDISEANSINQDFTQKSTPPDVNDQQQQQLKTTTTKTRGHGHGSDDLLKALRTKTNSGKRSSSGKEKRHRSRGRKDGEREKDRDRDMDVARLLAHEHFDLLEMRKVLVKTSERLEAESRRAQEAESRAREAESRVIAIMAQRQLVERQAAEELALRKAYEAQVAQARIEIQRAQEELNRMAESKYRAEEEAARERGAARQARHQMKLDAAGRQAYDRGIRHGKKKLFQELRTMGIVDGYNLPMPPPPMGMGMPPNDSRPLSGSSVPGRPQSEPMMHGGPPDVAFHRRAEGYVDGVNMPEPQLDGNGAAQFPQAMVDGVPIPDGPSATVQFPQPQVDGVPIGDGPSLSAPGPMSFPQPGVPIPDGPAPGMPQPTVGGVAISDNPNLQDFPLPPPPHEPTNPGPRAFIPDPTPPPVVTRTPAAVPVSMPVPDIPPRQPTPVQANLAQPDPIIRAPSPGITAASQHLNPEFLPAGNGTGGAASPRPASRSLSRPASRRSIRSTRSNLDDLIPTIVEGGKVDLPPPHALADIPKTPAGSVRGLARSPAPVINVDVTTNGARMSRVPDVSINIHQATPDARSPSRNQPSPRSRTPNIDIVGPSDSDRDTSQPPKQGFGPEPGLYRMGRYENGQKADPFDFYVESAASSDTEAQGQGQGANAERLARMKRATQLERERSLSTIMEVNSTAHTPEPHAHEQREYGAGQGYGQSVSPTPFGRQLGAGGQMGMGGPILGGGTPTVMGNPLPSAPGFARGPSRPASRANGPSRPASSVSRPPSRATLGQMRSVSRAGTATNPLDDMDGIELEDIDVISDGELDDGATTRRRRSPGVDSGSVKSGTTRHSYARARLGGVAPTIPAPLGPTYRREPPSAIVQSLEAQVRSPTVASHTDDDNRNPAVRIERSYSRVSNRSNLDDPDYVPAISVAPATPPEKDAEMGRATPSRSMHRGASPRVGGASVLHSHTPHHRNAAVENAEPVIIHSVESSEAASPFPSPRGGPPAPASPARSYRTQQPPTSTITQNIPLRTPAMTNTGFPSGFIPNNVPMGTPGGRTLGMHGKTPHVGSSVLPVVKGGPPLVTPSRFPLPMSNATTNIRLGGPPASTSGSGSAPAFDYPTVPRPDATRTPHTNVNKRKSLLQASAARTNIPLRQTPATTVAAGLQPEENFVGTWARGSDEAQGAEPSRRHSIIGSARTGHIPLGRTPANAARGLPAQGNIDYPTNAAQWARSGDGSAPTPSRVQIPITPAIAGVRNVYEGPVSTAQTIRTLAHKTPAAPPNPMLAGYPPNVTYIPPEHTPAGFIPGFTPAARSAVAPGSARTFNMSLAGKTPGARVGQLNPDNFAGNFSRGVPLETGRTPARSQVELPTFNAAHFQRGDRGSDVENVRHSVLSRGSSNESKVVPGRDIPLPPSRPLSRFTTPGSAFNALSGGRTPRFPNVGIEEVTDEES